MARPLKSRKRSSSPTALGSNGSLKTRLNNFISNLEHLPYAATLLQEKKFARRVMGVGVVIMAVGAAIFSVGWKLKATGWVETAFVITLIGWMMVILGFAFGVVGWAAKYIPIRPGKFRLKL